MEPDAATKTPRRRFFRLAGTGFWAVMDQGLFSGSNFVLNVMLARWLGPLDFGVFSLAYSMLLLMGTFHTAFITQPMLVFASRRYRGRFGSYLRALLRGHWVLTSTVAGLVALVGFVMVFVADRPSGMTLIACAFASPLILIQWMLRKACYVDLKPRIAAFAGAVYLALMVGGILLLRDLDRLNSGSAFVLLALASAVSASMLLASLLRYQDDPGFRAEAGFRRHALQEHWQYGRWGIGAVFLNWFGTDAYYLGITFLHGFEATATLRAAMNLILPAKQTFVALGTIALPMLVSARASGRLARAAFAMFGMLFSAAVLYAALLVAFRAPLVDFLYGTEYASILPAVLVLSAFPLFIATTRVLNTALHALEHPRGIFAAAIPSSTATLTLGMFLTWQFGVIGASVGLIVGATIGIVALASVLLRRMRGAGAAPSRV